MPKPPVGKLPQPLSRAALAAHVASTLARVGTERQTRDTWIRNTLGLSLRSNGLERAAGESTNDLHPWLLADALSAKLGLEVSLVLFPGQGRPRPKLLRTLRETGVARQLLVTRSRRDVLCVLLHLPVDKNRLFEELDRLGEPMVWEEVLEEDRQIESIAWRGLAQRLGEIEGFA